MTYRTLSILLAAVATAVVPTVTSAKEKVKPTQQALPVWNALPLLAVDMYGHAYLYDYGNNRPAYADAVLRNLNWGKIAARFERVRLLKTEL